MSSCTGTIDDAVAAVSDTFGWTVMARVVDAPTATHPDWVTSNWRQRPPGIMGDGRSSHYGEAVAWLRPTGAAEQVLGYIDA